MHSKISHLARQWVLILCAAATLTACGVPIAPIGLPSATPTATAPPSATPTLPPTPTPTPSPTPIPQARITSGETALQAGDYAAALQEYQLAWEGAETDEVRAAARLGLGRVYLASEDYPSALDTFRSLIADHPQAAPTASAYFLLAETYRALDRYAESAEAYAAYLQARPGILDAYVQERRGDMLFADGDLAGAIEAYTASVAAPRLNETVWLEFKIAEATALTGDGAGAIEQYLTIYQNSQNEFVRARADYQMGLLYLDQGNADAAYERFQDAVTNYPTAYDSYLALVQLVEAGVPVNDLYRGLVDYFAEEYGAAIDAFDRYMANTAEYDGTALYYRGLSLRQLNDPTSAVQQWDALIEAFPGDRFWAAAWDEKADTLWLDFDDPIGAGQTMVGFVDQAPESPFAPEYLFRAARYMERGGNLEEASLLWERLANDYPQAEQAFRGLFFAGITRYRQENYAEAKTAFQRALLLSALPADQAAANLWIGKVNAITGDAEAARGAWQQAAELDPTGYYSERARDLLLEREAFAPPSIYDLAMDVPAERAEAESWIRATFNLTAEVDLANPASLWNYPGFVRGNEYWSLGLYELARGEFEAVRQAVSSDPVETYRLTNYLFDLGLYRSTVFASRQVLDLAGLNDHTSLLAPVYFSHLRFGPYYKELILPAAQAEGLNPLLLFSVIRQESLFEGFVSSSAGARGLMQIMPGTGTQVAENLGWPENYTDSDLYRPIVSVRLGSHYLAQQIDNFDGDLYAALAAYNGGPGNAAAWKELAPNDQDLFLETVRIQETRTYIMHIYEIYTIYRRIYQRTP